MARQPNEPLEIDRALADYNLLGAALGDAASWNTWLAVLKAAFALPLSNDELITFRDVAGPRMPPRKRVRELWSLIGRRGGKSRMAAAVAVHAAAFCEHTLAPGEIGTVLVLAASQSQAQTVFEYVRGFFEASPVLRQEIESGTASEIRLRNGVVIAVHTNSFRTVRGRTLLACVFDEVAFWRDEASAIPDIETYRAVLPSLATTKGMLVGISTPYRRAGLLFQKHRDHFSRDSDDVLVVQGGSLDFNPSLTGDVIAAAIADDPEGARAEWDAEFRSDISALLDDSIIEAAIGDRPLELPPRREHRYICFVDASAGRHDAFTVAIAHKDGERCVMDVVRGTSAPFDPDTVAKEFAGLAKQYHCTEIVGDNFAAEWVAGAFKKCGIRYRRAEKPKSQLYLECLPLFARGQLNLPDHPQLTRELRLLERHTARSGKDRVDHGHSGSDDYANAACGALVLLCAPRHGGWAVGDWSGNIHFRWGGDNPTPANVANPQSPPDSAVHPESKPLADGLTRKPGPVRIW